MAVNNRLQDILDYRNLANTDPIKLMQLQNQIKMPMVNRAIGGSLDNQMDEVKNKIDMVGPLALSNLVDISLGEEARKDFKELENQRELEQLLAEQDQADADIGLLPFAGPEINNMVAQGQALEQGSVSAKTGGGLMQLAIGGSPMPTRKFSGPVQGDGHGMEDNVFMPIKDRGQQVATLAVSPKEYVVDAHTMAALGNGNPDAGAKVMDSVVENVREKAYGTDQQPNEISGLAALRPMIERV
tara:strand:- start:3 stop:731 length:729 start_codon:yes stop_codon:yes gene_type:complete